MCAIGHRVQLSRDCRGPDYLLLILAESFLSSLSITMFNRETIKDTATESQNPGTLIIWPVRVPVNTIIQALMTMVNKPKAVAFSSGI